MNKKTKKTFEELIEDNRKQILKDIIMLDVIEERMEKKWMQDKLS